MKRKFFVLGYFGHVTNQLDGQTIKTRDIFKLLKLKYPKDSIKYYDTQKFKYKRRSIISILRNACLCNHLIYLPGQNNLKYIFPILCILSNIFKFSIDYFVVGGWLADYLKDKPIYKYMLRHIKGIHVETRKLETDLQTHYNFKNVDIFPNFRFFDNSKNNNYTSSIYIKDHSSSKLRLVFISRVMQDKGLDILKELSNIMRQFGLSDKYSIDFYGEMTDNYYSNNLSEISNYNYKGLIEPSKVISTIKQYDSLIFPTHYMGEGCPGILIEALAAGVPIIASDWKYNSEFVFEDINGFLCRNRVIEDYMQAIIKLYENPNLKKRMGTASKKIAQTYSSTYASDLIFSYF